MELCDLGDSLGKAAMAVLSLRRNRTQHGCPLVGFLHPGVRLSSPFLTSLCNASVNFPLVPDTVPWPSPPCRPFHTVVAAPQRRAHTLLHTSWSFRTWLPAACQSQAFSNLNTPHQNFLPVLPHSALHSAFHSPLPPSLHPSHPSFLPFTV